MYSTTQTTNNLGKIKITLMEGLHEEIKCQKFRMEKLEGNHAKHI